VGSWKRKAGYAIQLITVLCSDRFPCHFFLWNFIKTRITYPRWRQNYKNSSCFGRWPWQSNTSTIRGVTQNIPDWRSKNHKIRHKAYRPPSPSKYFPPANRHRSQLLHFWNASFSATVSSTLCDSAWYQSTVALRYHNCCTDDGTSPEYFEFHLVVHGLSFHSMSRDIRASA
jgi:hypothetical protein